MKYKIKSLEDRNKKISEDFASCETNMSNLGKKYGITRERVRQIARLTFSEKDMKNINRIIKKKYFVTCTYKCKNCGKDKTIKGRKPQIFCDKACQIEYYTKIKNDPVNKALRYKKKIASIKRWRKEHPEKTKQYNKTAERKRDADSARKERHRLKVNARVRERYARDKKYRERHRKYQRDYYGKK